MENFDYTSEARRWFYFSFLGGDNGTCGSNVCYTDGRDFPVGQLSRDLAVKYGECCIILNWKEISHKQYLDYEMVTHEMRGGSHIPKPVSIVRSDVLPDQDTKPQGDKAWSEAYTPKEP